MRIQAQSDIGKLDFEIADFTCFEHIICFVEEEVIRAVLKSCKGNVKRAAAVLDMPRQTLGFKANEYILTRNRKAMEVLE